MAIKLSVIDYAWSYIGVSLSLFSNIIIAPFILYFLDGEHYGVWGVFQSLAGITILFDFGFTTTFGRNINYCWSGAERLEKKGVTYSKSIVPNFYLMKKTMIACQRVFLTISSFALLLMTTIGTSYILYIAHGLDSAEIIFAWEVYAIAIFLNLYFGYYGSFLRGVGAISQYNKSIVSAKLAQIIATIVFLISGFGLIGTSVAYLIYGTLFRVLAKRSFFKFEGIGENLKNIKIKIPVKEIKDTFLTVWFNAWREGLVSLSNYLSNQACTIIISLYMPLTQTGAYALGVQISTAVIQVASAIYRSNQPVLQSAYISNDKPLQKRTMSLIIFSFSSMYFFGMTVVTIVGLPILRLIRPEIVIGQPTLLALGAYQFILGFRNCYTSYFSCTNRIPYVKAFLISSIICIILSLMVMDVLNMGMRGIISVQIISQCMYNAWAWAIKAHKELDLSIRETITLGWDEMLKILKSFLKRSKSNE